MRLRGMKYLLGIPSVKVDGEQKKMNIWVWVWKSTSSRRGEMINPKSTLS